jgi:1,4-dihydroxy-2-naphthoate octaprenyltransferase
MFKIFSENSGWRRVLAESLQFVMYFGLVLSLASEVDNYLLPSRVGHPETIWHFIAIALVSGILIAWITRTLSFVWPTLLFATSIVFLIQSFKLFEGEEFPEHRTLDALAGVGCIGIYFGLFWLMRRLVERGKKTSASPKLTAD